MKFSTRTPEDWDLVRLEIPWDEAEHRFKKVQGSSPSFRLFGERIFQHIRHTIPFFGVVLPDEGDGQTVAYVRKNGDVCAVSLVESEGVRVVDLNAFGVEIYHLLGAEHEQHGLLGDHEGKRGRSPRFFQEFLDDWDKLPCRIGFTPDGKTCSDFSASSVLGRSLRELSQYFYKAVVLNQPPPVRDGDDPVMVKTAHDLFVSSVKMFVLLLHWFVYDKHPAVAPFAVQAFTFLPVWFEDPICLKEE